MNKSLGLRKAAELPEYDAEDWFADGCETEVGKCDRSSFYLQKKGGSGECWCCAGVGMVMVILGPRKTRK
jgi:hypothetical protein